MTDFVEKSNVNFATMIRNQLSISRQKTFLEDYRAKLLTKRAELLNEVGVMGHDDFVALLEIFDLKLQNINKQFDEQKPFKFI